MAQMAINPQTEAHITLVHGRELLHACSAAVNAETLRQADPNRARIIFAWNITQEMRELLSYGWQVQEPSVGGTLLDTESGRKAVVLDATLAGQSKPLSRAIFWDADHMVLPSSQRLQSLWAFRADAEIIGYPESAGCFNTGFMLFRPSLLQRRVYESLLEETAAEARGSYPRGDKRCVVTRKCWRNACQPNDQSYLNAVFSDKSAIVRRLRQRHGGGRSSTDVDVDDDKNSAYRELLPHDGLRRHPQNGSARLRYVPIPGTAFRMRTSTRFGAQYRSMSCLTTERQVRLSPLNATHTSQMMPTLKPAYPCHES